MAAAEWQYRKEGSGLAAGFAYGYKDPSTVLIHKHRGSFLPGYLPKTNLLGIDDISGAPGLAFVLGSQRDISQMAINGGWITRDSLQSQLYINTFREDYSITSTLEPFRDLRITLTANKNQTLNYASNFRYSNESGTFKADESEYNR